MAKRKKHHKKVHRAHASKEASRQPAAQPAEPVSSAQNGSGQPAAAAVTAPVPSSAVAPASPKSAITATRWAYVGRDVRRIGLLVVICVIVELGLWLLFGHTGLGSTVDSWVKL